MTGTKQAAARSPSAIYKQGETPMQTWKCLAAAVAFTATGSLVAVAQTTVPDDAATVTTPKGENNVAPAPSSQGSSTGEAGATSPAGIPADPTTNENQQPGMSPQNPSDPATGNSSGARAPTSPAGTGTSSQ
jgi:hypothetical protein